MATKQERELAQHSAANGLMSQAGDRPCIDLLAESIPLGRRHVGARHEVAFWAVTSVFSATMLGTTLPAPLYVLFQAQWHFSSGVVTLIFSVYALGVLAALLLAGHASDEVGRRPVMAAALGFTAVSTVLFILSPSLVWLYPARILSGLSAGLMTGTATVALADLVPASRAGLAPRVATAANMGGLGLGPLVAGVFAQYLPRPTVLVFEVYLGIVAFAGVTVALVPESVQQRKRLSLRFRGLGIPVEGRREFVAAGTAVFAAFALLGLFSSLAPGFIGEVLHRHNHAVAGAVIFLMFASAAAAAVVLARLNSRRVVLFGLELFPAALALIVAGLSLASLTIFVVGTAVGGVAVGAIFIGSLSTASRLAPPERRGRSVSTFFVFAYIGLTLPVIGVGLASEQYGDFASVLVVSIILAALCMFSAATILANAGGRSGLKAVHHPAVGDCS